MLNFSLLLDYEDIGSNEVLTDDSSHVQDPREAKDLTKDRLARIYKRLRALQRQKKRKGRRRRLREQRRLAEQKLKPEVTFQALAGLDQPLPSLTREARNSPFTRTLALGFPR